MALASQQSQKWCCVSSGGTAGVFSGGRGPVVYLPLFPYSPFAKPYFLVLFIESMNFLIASFQIPLELK